MCKVLWFITGQRYLPVGGFNALFIKQYDGKNCMIIDLLTNLEDGRPRVDITPNAQTCTQKILLPTYTSYEMFEWCMNQALKYGDRMDAA